MDYFKFYFNLFKNQKYLALFDKINQGDYATCTCTLIRSTQKLNFFSFPGIGLELLKTVANSDRNWEDGSFSRRIYITACLLGSVGWHVAEEIAMSVSARPLPSAAEDVRIHFKEFADSQITIPLL